jgi:1-acyl-sn-glycerol-3-phosphate acyltransferase
MAAGAVRADGFYRALRAVARFWIWFLYGAVDVRHAARVPAAGPVLLCINHPNNLIDSLLVGAVLPRKVHYVATATLFRNPAVAWALARAGVIPVHRARDGGPGAGQPDRNAGALAACRATLAAGGVVGIYPEGTTHAERRVQPIRSGAARIALDLGRADLAVVPVGLTFGARKAFRDRVRVAFGQPVPLGPALALARVDPAGAVAGLTAAIQAAMAAQVVHVEREATAGLVGAVEALYGDELVGRLLAERGLPPDAVDPVRLGRAIADAVAHFQARDPARVARMARRMARYHAHLAACRVRDGAVRARLGEPATAAPRRPGAGARAALGLPVFAYGAAVNAAPYLLTRWLARRLARRETDYATIRLLASAALFPLAWLAETWLVARAAGPAAAAVFALSLPLTGVLAHRYWHGLGRLESRVRLAWLAATRGHAASRLLAERQAIVRELERARLDYLAAARDPVR